MPPKTKITLFPIFRSLYCHAKPPGAPFGIRCTVHGNSTDTSALSSTTPTTGRSCRPPFSIGTRRRPTFASARWSGTESPSCCWTWTTAAAAGVTLACPTSKRYGSVHPCSSRTPSNRQRKSSANGWRYGRQQRTWKCRPGPSCCTRRAPGAIAAEAADTVAIAKWHLLPAADRC